MSSGLAILLLTITAAGVTPGGPAKLTDIHYKIDSSLDYANKALVEHTQVCFRADSLSPDSLKFWRMMCDQDQQIVIDSVLINGTRVPAPIWNRPISAGAREDYNPDSLVFTLVAADLLQLGFNGIDFFYKVKPHDHPDGETGPLADVFGYANCYPHLVYDSDTLCAGIERLLSFERIALKVKMSDDLYLMAEAKTHRSKSEGDTVEYSVDSLRTRLLFWAAFPIRCHVHRDAGPLEVEIYSDPECKISEQTIGKIGNALSFYRQQFGGIPYGQMNLLFVGLPKNAAGQVFNNFMFLSNGKDSLTYLQRIMEPLTRQFVSTLPHEAAHLWWGSAVNIKDTWLSEALASYWANQYEVQVNGEAPYGKIDFDAMRLVYRLTTGTPAKKGRNALGLKSYYKGPYILNMLALQIGSEDFAETCQEFYQKYRGRSPGFSEFKAIVQKHAHVPLDSFFTCWVDSNYSQNHSIKRIESRPFDSLYSNSIYLAKTGRAKSCVPIEIGYKDGTKETFLVQPDQLTHRWTSRSQLASVFIDPNKFVLEEKRSDNAWPTPVEFHTLKLSPIENVKLFASMFSDEPGYKTYLLPDIPSHSERFGWDYSCVLVGGGEDWFRDYFLDDGDIVRVGYNSRANGVMYRGYVSRKISNTADWRWTYNLFSERMQGRYESGMGMKYARYWSPNPLRVPFPAMTATVGLRHRQYHRLEHMDDIAWPIRNTTPLRVRVATSLLAASIEFERGLRFFSGDEEYYRCHLTIEREKHFYYGRIFVGTSGGDAVQERFDPSDEGGMKGYPPFRDYYDRLLAVNMLLKHRLLSLIGGRLFGNYVSPMSGGYSVSEFGVGVSVGDELFNLVLDVPAYLSDSNIDGKRWDFSRFRIQLRLFSPKRIPKWDFLVN